MNWLEENISDVASIGDGAHASLRRIETGVPYLTAKNITTDGIDYSGVSYISESTYAKHFSNNRTALTTPIEGDVLYSIIGSIGGVYIVKDERIGISSSIAIFRANPDKVLPQYLYYFIKSSLFNAQVQAIRGGVAQSFLSLGKLGTIKIKYPNNLDYQRKLADILSSYDDLIENNQKQIKLLEEAAQRLYKEWFIDLHFPGHEDCKIVDGVPEGWRKELLTDIAEIQYGFSFDGSTFNSEKKGHKIIRIRNIPDSTTKDYTTQTADDQYIVHNGDIVVGMDGEFHINSWSGGDAYLVQRTCSFRPHDETMKGYLLQAIYEPIKFFEKTLVGATVAHLGKKNIDTIRLLIPPPKYYQQFEKGYKLIQNLREQNILLQEARDRLLPKLMSGEIEL